MRRGSHKPSARPGHGRGRGRGSPAAAGSDFDARALVDGAAALVGLVILLYLVGLVVSWVQFSAARLPGAALTSTLSTQQLFGEGLRSTALTGAAFAVLCLAAYLTATFRWEVNGQEWHDIVRGGGVDQARPAPEDLAKQRAHRVEAYRQRKRTARQVRRAKLGALLPLPAAGGAGAAGATVLAATPPRAKAPAVQAPLGDAGVRIIAGFNMLVISVLLSLEFAHGVDGLLPAGWRVTVGDFPFLLAWGLGFLVLHLVFVHLGPLRLGGRAHAVLWGLVGVAALLASAPLGLLVLTGVAIATWGRRLGRIQQPNSLTTLIRSPIPWVLIAIVTLLGLAYHAMPPVSFPYVSVATAAGDVTGGYVTRGDGGVYVVTCTALADATSINEHVRFLRPSTPAGVILGGPTVSFDSGERPSLLTLGLRALGLDGAVEPLFVANLHPKAGTCAGSSPLALTGAREDPALGAGVIVPAPGVAPKQAHDGEPPIEAQEGTPAAIARLARQYQPTLLVTVADRFWPVSVNALLADRRENGDTTCLIQKRSTTVCGSKLTAQDLSGPGSTATDYLQFPEPITHDPDGVGQFKAFMNGQDVNPGPLHAWLADPGLLRPWYTAQIYFYLGPTVSLARFPTPATSLPPATPGQRFIPLEYWFYYPYNYFPLLSDSHLMDAAPLAGDNLNVDFHQGDWEHVDVLLDAATLKPAWLYMARHSGEGQFVQWGSPYLALDAGHPIVQAALGGHPTYEPGCGVRIRNQPASVLDDWLVCGSGRFAFRATSTPLVDIARQPWVCWPGHFGAAGTRDEIQAATKNEGLIDQAWGQVYVAGPQAPALQAENYKGTCSNAGGREEQVVRQYGLAR
ncbi:MAG TPA: hypothetical protein VG186_18160 [Solirubrobacteraceae bacterium]|nr:hypothetical protein [Solirubrobacteraceae bacterium]